MAINIKHSVITLIGTLLGQASLFLVVFILGRGFGASFVGEFNYLVSLATFLGTVTVFRYELACVTGDGDKSVYAMSHVIALLILVVLLCSITSYLLSVPVSGWLWVLVCGYSFSQILSNVLNAEKKYFLMAILRSSPNFFLLLIVLFQVFFLEKLSDSLLRWYGAIFVLVPLVFFAPYARKVYSCIEVRGLSWEFFFENRNYPLYIFPGTLLGAVATYFLALAIPVEFGAKVAGYFAIAYRLGAFPVGLIAQSIGNIIRRDCIDAVAVGMREVRSLLRKYSILLAFLAVAYLIFGNIAIDYFVSVVFGQDWGDAAKFFHCLSPMFAAQLVFVPISQAFLVLREQRKDFLMQLALGGGLVVSWGVMRLCEFEVMVSVLVFSSVGFFLYGMGVWFVFKSASEIRG